MALSIALKRATAAASTLSALSRFPSAGRSFTATAATFYYGKPDVAVQGPPQNFRADNPFQIKDGPKGVVDVDGVENGLLVRLVLPGVGPDGVKVWAENDTVYFTAEGETEVKNEEGRKYGGSLQFSPEEHRVEGVTSEMKYGILRLFIPSVEAAEEKKEK